jgi:hypothetical protein
MIGMTYKMEETFDRYKDFLMKLAALSAETGVYIENFGDSFYDPFLTIEPNKCFQNNKEHPVVFLCLDCETGEYVGTKDNPYDGETI